MWHACELNVWLDVEAVRCMSSELLFYTAVPSLNYSSGKQTLGQLRKKHMKNNCKYHKIISSCLAGSNSNVAGNFIC